MEEYYQQLAASVLINPGVGVLSSNGTIFSGVIFSNKRVLLIGHEIVDLLYASNTGNILDLAYLSVLIQRSAPASNIDDSRASNTGVPASKVNNLQFNFYYGYQYASYIPVIRPINLILQPNQQVVINFSARYMTPVTSATDSLQFTYRIFWRELE
jgi:hypothetical protein